MSDHGTHETYRDREAEKGSSDRSFGIIFTVLFAIIGAAPMAHGLEARWWALIVSALFLIAALTRPKILAPLNRLWLRVGLLLHRVVNPLIMGLLFFLVITPIGLIMRLTGKRPLQLETDPNAPTYWIRRSPPGPTPESMKQQF